MASQLPQDDLSASPSLELPPPRPPTPPRETRRDCDHDISRLPAHATGPLCSDKRLNIQTPPNLPTPDSSTAGSTVTGSCRGRKKVEWSAQPDRVLESAGSDLGRFEPPSARSASSEKPVKGILKPSAGPPETPGLLLARNPVDQNINVAELLQATINLLSTADNYGRLDGYRTLARALRNSDNLPDRAALRDRITVFAQFIQRDLTQKSDDGVPDSTTATAVLELLSTLMQFAGIMSRIPVDFGIFVVDYAIRGLEDVATPKSVLRHIMLVICRQNFTAKVMTPDRIGRLVRALHTLEDRVQGKSIIYARCQIYSHLIKQSRASMISHGEWLLDLFADMLSNLKDIRSVAIHLGLEAGFGLGKEKQLQRKVMDLLQHASGDRKYVEFYVEKLKEMSKSPDSAMDVARIWGVVLLLLRGPLERWEFFNPFLQLIQACFNSSSFESKKEANLAWNRLIYLMHFEERSFSKLISTLVGPVLTQLRRKTRGKPADGKKLRTVMHGSVCNFFHYTFGPSAKPQNIAAYWDSSAKPLLTQLSAPESVDPDDVHLAIQILTRLLDPSPRMYNVDVVTENRPCRPDDLPALDPKWVRKNSSRVLEVVQPILESRLADLASQESPIYGLWRALSVSVASAAAKEIKISTETTAFIAQFFNVLSELWLKGPGSLSPFAFLHSMRELVGMVVGELGVLPFTEKMLSVSSDRTFTAVPTPPQRPTKLSGPGRAPLGHLFTILSTLPPEVSDDQHYAAFFGQVFAPFFSASPNKKSRSALAHELTSLIPANTHCPYGPWALIAEQISCGLGASQDSTTSSTASTNIGMGSEYREVVGILVKGLGCALNLPGAYWLTLLGSLASRVTDECGEAGRALAVVEPLAKVLLDRIGSLEGQKTPDNMIRIITDLTTMAVHPRDRQALDASRRLLWGTATAGSRSFNLDPYDAFYKLDSTVLERLYDKLAEYDAKSVVAPLIDEITKFVERCNPSIAIRAISNLQPGIAIWLQDEKAQVGNRLDTLGASLARLFDRIGNTFLLAGEVGLEPVDRLLCGAFQSKHRHIVNAATTLWNRKFDDVVELEYPAQLKAVLLSVCNLVDINLPGLEPGPSDEMAVPDRMFVDSQEESTDANLPSETSGCVSRVRAMPDLSVPQRKENAADDEPEHQEDAAVRTRAGRLRNSKPKLRHDDSQVVFEPIASSPPRVDNAESQVLTERQLEVRERQRENATLFPEIGSSPKCKTVPVPLQEEADEAPLTPETPHQPAKADTDVEAEAEAETPEPDADYDYVNSTPTPRRGQTYVLEDGETDPPSSPPEPRSYQRIAQLRRRSKSSEALDNWEFSSPTSVSPAPAGRVVPSSLSEAEAAPAPAAPDPNQQRAAILALAMQARTPPKSSAARPVTPRRVLRSASRAAEVLHSEDVFVDAPSTPLPITPQPKEETDLSRKSVQDHAADSADAEPVSFELGEDEERSMVRVADAIGARSLDVKSVSARTPLSKATDDELGSRKKRRRPSGDENNGSLRKKRRSPVAPVGSQPGKVERISPAIEPSLEAPAALAETAPSPRDSNDCGESLDDGDTDNEVMTQLQAEQTSFPSADRSASAQGPERVAVEYSLPMDIDDGKAVEYVPQVVPDEEELAGALHDEVVVNESSAVADTSGEREMLTEDGSGRPTVANKNNKAMTIMGFLRQGLEELKTASLSRRDMCMIEDMFVDVKRELYEAERRGRK